MPYVIKRTPFKDTLHDIFFVPNEVQLGRIGIPKQVRRKFFGTLRARGVCSRIPHRIKIVSI